MPAISHELIKQASEAYNLKSDSFQLVEDASNPSYFVEYQGKSAFLRMSSRPENLILAEIDFMQYLSKNGIRVSEIYPAKNGDSIASIKDDSQSYTLTLFEKLPGEHPEGDLLTDDVISLYGRNLGKMHRLGAEYTLASPEIRRPVWHELEPFDILGRIPQDQIEIRQKCESAIAKIRAISENNILIHADTEPWNALLHNNSLGWIDFDECCYFHPVFDIAVSMMYILIASVDDVLKPDHVEKNKTAQHVWTQLYQGLNTCHLCME